MKTYFAAIVTVIAVASSQTPGFAYDVCRPGDGKTRIGVWKPKLSSLGAFLDEPPIVVDGKLYFVSFSIDDDKAGCSKASEDHLYSFTHYNDSKNHGTGGIAVNFRGNVQHASGYCVFSGIYMNEFVAGIHEGFTETYFGSVSKEKIVTSGRFCVQRQPN